MKFPAVRATILLGLSCAFLAVRTPPALAHDSLQSSSPAKNSVVSGVERIELEFSANVSFPVVVLHDAAGRRFESGTPRTKGPEVVQGVTGPLPSGSYVIAWRVVSADGHPVEGEIPFTVHSSSNAAAGVPASPPSESAAAPAASRVEPAGISGWVLAGIALLIVIGVAALLSVRRGERTDTT